MENPAENKKIAEIFSRYLKNQFGYQYLIVVPKNSDNPEFDVKLISKKHGDLLLQLTQPIIFESCEKILAKSKYKSFKIDFSNSVVKKENKYKEKAKDIILIFHLIEGYHIPSDIESIDKHNFISTFKGVYIISPEYELWGGNGKTVQNEFVLEIKNAFTKELLA